VPSDPNPGGDCSPSDGFLKRRGRQTQVLAKCLGYGRLRKALMSTKTRPEVRVGEGLAPRRGCFSNFGSLSVAEGK
jgi:hypothetical protein